MQPLTSVSSIPDHLWGGTPFLKKEFFNALEKSCSIGPGSGWEPLFFMDDNQEGVLFSFMKGHSYGEYIFDWEWARAYEQHGIPYYPKLTSMIPFTPATSSHFLKSSGSLLTDYEEFYNKYNFSSSHFLFLAASEIDIFRSNDYLIRDSMQYHFFNEGYDSFGDYLSRMKAKKAKHVALERKYSGLKIEKMTGDALNNEHAVEMYEFYISTIENKNAIDYLRRDFFLHIFGYMKENVLYVRASRDGKCIAGSLFFYDAEKLYGRYWGANEYIENLHFELCYYQGIEFAIEKKLKVFEAGAQGEHKIARGFRPVRTYSAHKLKHPAFHGAIKEFIKKESEYITMNMDVLTRQLPFRINP